MSAAKALIASLAILIYSSPLAAQSTDSDLSLPMATGPASFERVGEVLVSAMVCQPFGYSVDREGLAVWAQTEVSSLANQTDGYGREDVLLRVNRAATARYWFLRNRYLGAFRLENQSGRYGARQFTREYRDHCATLSESSYAGDYFAKTSKEPRRLELMARMRSVMLNDETVRLFARAYPPYLGYTLGLR